MYLLDISEVQRRIIMRGLTKLGADPKDAEELKNEPGDVGHGGFDTAQEELVCMITMFGLLPDDEAREPGVLHGFCL